MNEATSPRLRELRKSQVKKTGMVLAVCGMALSLIAVVADLYFVNPLISVGDLFIFLGCALGSLLNYRRKVGGFVWWPFYLGFWLASFPILGITGGGRSPYYAEWMIILFTGGIVVQSRYSQKQVLTFVAVNAIVWLALPLEALSIPQVLEPAALERVRNVLLLLGSILIIRIFLRNEKELVQETENQGLEIRDMELRLAESQKFAEIGSLMATTAHEIAQPVQVITMTGGLLGRLTAKDGSITEDIRTMIARVNDAASRLSRLLIELKDFSRRDHIEPVLFDISQAVDGVELLISHDLRTRRIRLAKKVLGGPHLVLGDSQKVQQILLNLINNARDAVTGTQDPCIEINVESREPWVRLIVKNSGPGIPLEIQKDLFKSYFTTKKRGQGTGLGLSVCAKLVDLHHGRLMFSSQENDTRFVVDLPRAKR